MKHSLRGVMIYYYNRTKEWTTNNAFYVDYIDTAKSYQPFRSHSKLNQARTSCRIVCFINKKILGDLELLQQEIICFTPKVKARRAC
jgi:hypothetical protein